MSLSAQDAQAIISVAGQLQVDPRVLGGLMELESNMDPNIWGGAGGKYRGLIQFGPGARQEVGLPDGPMTIADQMPYVKKYFDQRGFVPGKHGTTELYRTVLVGNPRQSGTDSFGTNSDRAARRMEPGGDLYQRAAAKLERALGGGINNRAPGPAAMPSPQGENWLEALTRAAFAGSGAAGQDIELGMDPAPRRRPAFSADPVTAYAEASLEQGRMAGSSRFRDALTPVLSRIAAAAPLTARRARNEQALLTSEETEWIARQQQQQQPDAMVGALQQIFAGPGSAPVPAQPMNGIRPMAAVPRGAKRATDLLTVDGGRFGASRDGGSRVHKAWDLAGEDGTVLMLDPESGASWGEVIRGDYGDKKIFHTPEGSFDIIHGEWDGNRGAYRQAGWGPGGRNAYAPHFDIAAVDPRTGKRTGAYFPRELLGRYLLAARL